MGDQRPFEVTMAGKAALGLFTLNTALLFFPPIPPDVRGSLWSYLIKTAVIVLIAVETWRLAPHLVDGWAATSPRRRWSGGLGTIGVMMMIGALVWWLAPTLFGRSVAEVGPWETISTATYAAAAALLWSTSSRVADDDRRHLRLLAGCFVLLVLEETDYAGIIGGIVGRIDGIYVGSLHDLLPLAAQGALGVGPAVLVAAGVLITAGLLAWGGYLQPRSVLQDLRSGAGLWLAVGFAIGLFASLGEAGLAGSVFAGRSPEEAIEAGSSVCLGFFALELVAARTARQGVGAS